MRYTSAMSGMRWNQIGLIVAAIMAVTAIGLWLVPAGRWPIVAAAIVAASALIAMSIYAARPRYADAEVDAIEELDPARRNELIRGSSMHLREMRYRYSVRSDRSDAAQRKAFTAVVNTIRLGFVPVILTDNETDYQGYGYLAFVYDGHRWRGPGLPCPDGREEAIAHAERSVMPADNAS